MSILSDFFIAEAGSVPSYDGGDGFVAQDKCQFRRITPLEASGMLAVLRGGIDRMQLLGEFELLTPQDAEEWTMSIPQDMVELLAAANQASMPFLAKSFAEVTSGELGWQEQDFMPVVEELSALAKRALDSGKAMFLWNCL